MVGFREERGGQGLHPSSYQGVSPPWTFAQAASWFVVACRELARVPSLLLLWESPGSTQVSGSAASTFASWTLSPVPLVLRRGLTELRQPLDS